MSEYDYRLKIMRELLELVQLALNEFWKFPNLSFYFEEQTDIILVIVEEITAMRKTLSDNPIADPYRKLSDYDWGVVVTQHLESLLEFCTLCSLYLKEKSEFTETKNRIQLLQLEVIHFSFKYKFNRLKRFNLMSAKLSFLLIIWLTSSIVVILQFVKITTFINLFLGLNVFLLFLVIVYFVLSFRSWRGQA